MAFFSGALGKSQKAGNGMLTDFGQLIKIRLSLTVVFSSFLAYWAALPPDASLWQRLPAFLMGGFLLTAAANALNQVIEKDYDALMGRTATRPLPSGRMGADTAILAAGLMSVAGLIALATFTVWAALLGAVSLILYAFVYTPLKRISPLAVTVGAIPGAIPVLIGALAARGDWSPLGWALFGIQFFWQFPHFFAIAWLGHQDYHRAGFRISPENGQEPGVAIGRQAFGHSLFLLPVLLLCLPFNLLSWIAIFPVLVMTLVYITLSYWLYRRNDKKAALSLLFFSFVYIPAVFFLFLFDNSF